MKTMTDQMAMPVGMDDRINQNSPAPTLIPFKFRWPVRQTGDNEIECVIPRSACGGQILDPHFVASQHLNGNEIEEAEFAVLKQIAVIAD